MNELASVVSEGITGEVGTTIELCGKFYAIKAPTTYVLAKLLKPLSFINIEDKEVKISGIAKEIEQSHFIDEALAIAVMGDVSMNPINRYRLRKLKKVFAHASGIDRAMAFKELISTINPDFFFLSAQLAIELTKRLAKPKS